MKRCKSCKNCCFSKFLRFIFDRENNNVREYECRRYPPTNFINNTDFFPHVFTNDANEKNDCYCGEWKDCILNE